MRWKYVAERARMVRGWRSWVPKVARIIKELWPNAEVYLIGSAARGEAIGSSDVDLLIVLEKPPEKPRDRARTRILVEERAGLPDHNPLDMHFASFEERDEWLRRAGKHIRIA